MAAKKKWYKYKFFALFIRVSFKLMRVIAAKKDKKICGVSLEPYVPTIKEGESTGSQSTCYPALDEMFRDAKFTDKDSYIDVGCGRGRTICYLLGKKTPMKLTGIEHNEQVAEFTKSWASKYKNVEIICGDAFKYDFNAHTVLFMNRPFLTETFCKFIDYLESTLTHPIKLYYWVDSQSGDHLNDRPGWTMLERKRVFFLRGFFIFTCPQRYSIWTFDPAKLGNKDK